MINLRIRYVLTFLFVFFLIAIIIFYNKEKPNVNEVIEQSIIEKEEEPVETVEVEEEKENKDDELETNTDDSSDPLKDMIVDSVINAIDFFLMKDINIVAIGDSLTQGVGDRTKEGGYIGILDQMINHDKNVVSFENFGKSGNRTDQLLKRLDEPEISSAIEKSEIVLITIGANDIMQVVKENFANLTFDLFVDERVQYERRLYDTLNKVKDLNPNVHIYLLGIYNPFARYFEEIEELDDIVNEWNVTSNTVTESFEKTTFIPIKDLFEDTHTNLFADDHFHPNRIGYHRMAERVLEYLTSEGER